MRLASQLALAAFAAVSLTGCRFKSWESFRSATTPNPPASWKGDPYSFGSVADASGGLKPQTNYGSGARLNSTGPIDPSYDQPAKGSGQQPGEYGNANVPGFGQTNAPGLQPAPGSVGVTIPNNHG